MEHERNVVAAVVSTAEHVRNTRSKPRPLARASLQLFCYDDAAFLPLAKNGSAREQDSWRGLFAIADIAKNEIVAVKGGHIVDRKILREKIALQLGPVEVQIHDDLFIAPVTEEEREFSMLR